MTTLNDEPKSEKPCIFDHADGLILITRGQSDGTSYEYCQGCGWVDIASKTREAREDELKRADKNAHKIGDYFKQRLRMIELDRLANLTKDYEYDDVRDTTAESKAKEARNKLKKKG